MDRSKLWLIRFVVAVALCVVAAFVVHRLARPVHHPTPVVAGAAGFDVNP